MKSSHAMEGQTSVAAACQGSLTVVAMSHGMKNTEKVQLSGAVEGGRGGSWFFSGDGDATERSSSELESPLVVVQVGRAECSRSKPGSPSVVAPAGLRGPAEAAVSSLDVRP